MKTAIAVIAVFSLAAPAFAQDYGYGSYPGDDDGYGYRDDDAPPPQAGPTLDDFQNDDELSWNGEWVSTPEYGVVWRPTQVNDDWRPYVNGRWVWTQAGWAWASDEPFGWAVYHYGRWAWTPDLGWAWIPGSVWGPAWVAWRWDEGYVSWCPLGPSGRVYQRPALWVVVRNREFLEPVRHHVVPRYDRSTVPLPAPGAPRAAPPVSVIERAIGRPVRTHAIGDGNRPGPSRAGGGTVWFYRPRATAPVAPPPRADAREPQPSRPQTRPMAVPVFIPVPQAQPASPGAPHASAPRATAPAAAPTPSRPQAPPTPSRPQATPATHAPHAEEPHAGPPHAVAPKSTSEQPRVTERQ